MIPPATSEQIIAAAGRFDAELRGAPEWLGWEENQAHKHALVIAGRRYPVKKVLSLATGIPVANFSGGEESTSFLSTRGFEVVPLRTETVSSDHDELRSPLQLILESLRECPYKHTILWNQRRHRTVQAFG